MNDFAFGVILLLVGILLTFWGSSVLRALIAIVGAFVGFVLGAELVQQQVGGELLGTFWGWVAAIVGALLLGALAYAWYWLGVVLWVAAMGYVIGVVVTNAFGVEKQGVLVAAGVVTALVLVTLAVVLKLPALLLVLMSASSGASLAITAVMLFTDVIDGRQVDRAFSVVEPAWPWYVAAIAVFVVGVLAQLQRTSRSSTTVAGG